MQGFNSRWPAIFVGFGVFFADIISKYLTHLYIPLISTVYPVYPYGGIGIFHNFLGIEFSIIHTTNRGAAWGILSDFQIYLLILRIMLIIALSAYFLWFNKHRLWQIPLALIIAGATGNVIDYFIYGHVVDMLHFKFWGYDFAVFNVADSAVTIGIFSLAIVSSMEKKSHVTG